MITSLITSRNRYFIANKRRLIRANVKRIENSLQNYRYFCLDVQTIVTIWITKRAQLKVAQIRLIVKEQDRGLLGRRHR